MVQQQLVHIDGIDEDKIFIHDDVQFVNWCNECIDILNKVKGIGQANMHVYDVITKFHNEYSVQVAAILSDTGKQLEGSMFVGLDELVKVVGLDSLGFLDIVHIDEKKKLELYKYLISRFWDYYRYGKKFFKK